MINSKLIKNLGEWKIRSNIVFDNIESDRITLEFYADDDIMEIFSTSSGYIQNNKINVYKVKTINIDTEYKRNISKFECIISYYDRFGVRQDNLTLNIPRINGLHFTPSVRNVAPVRNQESEWKIKLSVQEDIIAFVEKSKDAAIFVSFGEISDNPLSSDIDFVLTPVSEKFVIPKEVIWSRNYEKIMLGCFELVEHYGMKDVFHKVLISNILNAPDLPKKSLPDLSDFKQPMGNAFDKKLWRINEESGLPQFVGTYNG